MDEKTEAASDPAGPETSSMVRGCLGLVVLSTFCMVGAAALVYGAQWLLGW